MNLQLPTHHGVGYKSGSQLARRITEPWGADNLYCCACTSDQLTPEKTNAQVSDFLCPKCVERYQLKSHSKKLGAGILGSNYQKMLDAVDRAEAIAGIRRGLDDMRAGRGRPFTEFVKEMRERYNIPESS